MTKADILKINTITNSILKIENKIRILELELNEPYDYVEYSKGIDNFGFFNDSLDIDSMNDIVTQMKFHNSDDNNNIRVKIEHTTENTDPYEDYETPVTNVVIYADVNFTQEKIEIAKAIKLSEIYGLKDNVIKLEKELMELINVENI